MLEQISRNAGAFIGAFGVLLGVIITALIENRRRIKELKDINKPILINYKLHHISDESTVQAFYFESDEKPCARITGIFKNTDNGILFIDCVKTETKCYTPKFPATIDKNIVFYLILENTQGETTKQCLIYCHDILGTPYLYHAKFCFERNVESQIILIDDAPQKRKKLDLATQLLTYMNT